MFDNEYNDFANYNMLTDKEEERLASMTLWELFNWAELEVMQEFPSFNEVDNEELLKKHFRQRSSDEYPCEDQESLLKLDSPSMMNLFTPSTNVDLYDMWADAKQKADDEPCRPAPNHLNGDVLRNGTESNGNEESYESITVVVNNWDEEEGENTGKPSKKDKRFGKQSDRGKTYKLNQNENSSNFCFWYPIIGKYAYESC